MLLLTSSGFLLFSFFSPFHPEKFLNTFCDFLKRRPQNLDGGNHIAFGDIPGFVVQEFLEEKVGKTHLRRNRGKGPAEIVDAKVGPGFFDDSEL